MKRKLTCTNYFIILEKKIFKRANKISNANVRTRPDVTVLAVGYHPPPDSQLAFHLYYVKYENTLRCKRIIWDSGGGVDVLKIFFSLSYMYNTKGDHFSLKIKPYIYGKRKSNAKS